MPRGTGVSNGCQFDSRRLLFAFFGPGAVYIFLLLVRAAFFIRYLRYSQNLLKLQQVPGIFSPPGVSSAVQSRRMTDLGRRPINNCRLGDPLPCLGHNGPAPTVSLAFRGSIFAPNPHAWPGAGGHAWEGYIWSPCKAERGLPNSKGACRSWQGPTSWCRKPHAHGPS